MRKLDTPKRVGFLSDVHGNYTSFRHAVRVAFDEGNVDRLVICGDIINKGPDSLAVLEKTRKLVLAKKAILTVGNHELALMAAEQEIVKRRKQAWREIKNHQSGGKDIFKNAQKRDIDVDDLWELLLRSPLFYKDKERFAVHAGLVKGQIAQTVLHLEAYRRKMKEGYFRNSPAIESFELARQEEGALDAPEMLVVTGHHSHAGPVLTSGNKRARLATSGPGLDLIVHEAGHEPILERITS